MRKPSPRVPGERAGPAAGLGAAAAWTGGLLAVFIPLSVWRYRQMS
jgi:hypothetical protein